MSKIPPNMNKLFSFKSNPPRRCNHSDSVSISLLSAVLNDDPAELFSILSDTSQINDGIEITSFKIPSLLISSPPILSVAAFFGAVECVSALIALNADIDQVDNFGRTPSHFAAAGGKLEIIRILDKDSSDKYDNYPIHYAAQCGRIDAIRYFWSKDRDLGIRGFNSKKAIHLACQNGHLPVVQFLNEQGCSLEDADEDGLTPLMYACRGGHLKTVEYLIQRNVHLDNTSKEGITPIVFAAQNGFLSIVKLLVNKNVVYKYAKRKYTPLVESAGGGHLDIVKYFINLGVDPNIKTSDGVTPLSAAVMKGRYVVVKYLMKHGANYKNCTLNFNSYDKTSDVKYNLAMIACICNSIDIVRFFYEKGYFHPSELTTSEKEKILVDSSEEMIRYLYSIGTDIVHVFSDIKDLFKCTNNIEKMYLFAKSTDEANITKFGVCIDYAYSLGYESIMNFFLKSYKYDFSCIQCTDELPKKKPLNENEAKMMMLMFMIENGGTEPDATGQSPAGLFALRMNDLKMVGISIERGAAINPQNLMYSFIISKSITDHQEILLDKFLSFGVDLNKLYPDENETEESEKVQKLKLKTTKMGLLPLTVCLRSLINHYPHDNGTAAKSNDDAEKEFLLKTLKKLLEHGAKLWTSEYNHFGIVIGVNSPEIFELVQQYSDITKECIEQNDLLSKCIANFSPRYFDFFLSFHPNLATVEKGKWGHSTSVFNAFKDQMPQDLAVYFLSRLLDEVDSLETRNDVISAILTVGSVELAQVAHNKGVQFNTDETLDCFSDVISTIKPDMLRFLISKGFDPSRKIIRNKLETNILQLICQKCEYPSREVFNILIESGVSIEKNTLKTAIESKNIIMACFLVDAGAKIQPDISDIFYERPDTLYLYHKLVQNGYPLKEVYLEKSIFKKNKVFVQYLFDQGLRLSNSSKQLINLIPYLKSMGFDSNFIDEISN